MPTTEPGLSAGSATFLKSRNVPRVTEGPGTPGGIHLALGRMTHWLRSIQSGGLLVALLAYSAPLYALTQCPPEFGPKNPMFDVIGWLILALGIVAGGLFAAYVLRRSRKMRPLSRLSAAIAGLVGMVVIWCGGLMLSFAFFLSC